MKKFLLKYQKYLAAGALLVLFIAGAIYIRISQAKEKPVSNISLSPTPTLVPTIDPKIKEFGLKIDKLNLLVPIIKDVDGGNKEAYNKALKEGVAHFKDSALPGEKGNIFIFGHSSAEVRSDYWKIFATLSDLEVGNEISVFYQGNVYKYKVSEKKTVEPTDLSVLKKGKKEVLTLMTCWPLGTNLKRLIIKAEPM
jgi:sortase A